MEHFIELGMFLGKSVLVVMAFGAMLSLLVSIKMKVKESEEKIEVKNINKKIEGFSETIRQATLDKKQKKQDKKNQKKLKKAQAQKNQKRAFVLRFEGDIKASAVKQLRDEITALLNVAKKDDEVILLLESRGGMVHPYGLAASQLLRIKKQKLPLTVCVDQVAASGGYLMACTAHKILVAPFAIVGSIGVLASVPNLHRLLKKHDVDYQEITAGEYKRTVSLMAEITPQGQKRFTEQIQDTHTLFKDFVLSERPQLDMTKVGTGEYWYGKQALELKLVDELKTSDELLFELSKTKDIYQINMTSKKTLSEKLSETISLGVEKTTEKLWQRWSKPV